MGMDIHVVNMDVETIAVIKKNKKYNTKGCVKVLQELSWYILLYLDWLFFFPCLSEVVDGMYNIVNDPEIFILETA